MRGIGVVTVLASLVLSACGASDDPRARLRGVCDAIAETLRSDMTADSKTALADERKEVDRIVEETADGGTDTHDLAEGLAWELEAGGTVGAVAFRTTAACEQIYDYAEES